MQWVVVVVDVTSATEWQSQYRNTSDAPNRESLSHDSTAEDCTVFSTTILSYSINLMGVDFCMPNYKYRHTVLKHYTVNYSLHL